MGPHAGPGPVSGGQPGHEEEARQERRRRDQQPQRPALCRVLPLAQSHEEEGEEEVDGKCRLGAARVTVLGGHGTTGGGGGRHASSLAHRKVEAARPATGDSVDGAYDKMPMLSEVGSLYGVRASGAHPTDRCHGRRRPTSGSGAAR
ncbi:conserved hypothetical protein [Micrococcus sp. 116]|nr:conserved hypothetical protein [Micrococcus sp. 116]